jgi:hypothetical protein
VNEETLIAELTRLYHEREISEDEIERRAKQGDLVYAIWPDRTKPHRFDYGVLKGDELHMRGPVHQANIMVIPCKSHDDAIMTKNMFFGPPDQG